MNPSKLLFVAVTRFAGILMLISGLLTATYVVGYYHRSTIVYEQPAVHAEMTLMFWLTVLQVVLRVIGAVVLFARAEPIINSLCAPEDNPGVKSLVVAFVKLNGFILLFYAVLSGLTPEPFVYHLLHDGWSALPSAGAGILRICLHLISGFLIVACADKIVDGLERCGAKKQVPGAA